MVRLLPRLLRDIELDLTRHCLTLAINNPDDWYRVTQKQLEAFGGKKLLSSTGSVLNLLSIAYPEKEWLPWRFERCPLVFWEKMENQIRFVDYLGAELGYTTREHWYQVKHTDFAEHGGSSLLSSLYRSSPVALLRAVYPDFDWKPWLFPRVPADYYDHQENVRDHLEWIKEKAHLVEDAELTKKHFEEHGAVALLHKFGNSPARVVEAAGGMWLPSKKPPKHWNDIDNQIAFMRTLGDRLGFQEGERERWYLVSPQQIAEHGGGGLLGSRQYNRSLRALLSAVFPDYDWLPWKFAHADKFAWKDPDVIRKAVSYIAEKLHLNHLEDWYNVSMRQISELGLAHLFAMNGGVLGVIQLVHPEIDWLPWKFSRFDDGAWNDAILLRKALDHVEEALCIKDDDDWYRVTSQQLSELGLSSLAKGNGGLVGMLRLAYPDKNWTSGLSAATKGFKKSNQHWLVAQLRSLWPNLEVQEDVFPATLGSESKMQLDAFVPALHLAFEYQGAQHYRQLQVYGDVGQRVQRDEAKAAACAKRGISLVSIPYWWDGTKETLVESIVAARPELQHSLT